MTFEDRLWKRGQSDGSPGAGELVSKGRENMQAVEAEAGDDAIPEPGANETSTFTSAHEPSVDSEPAEGADSHEAEGASKEHLTAPSMMALLARGQRRGFVTMDEVNDALPEAAASGD